MESIDHLLHRYSPGEPDEIRAIKRYIQAHFRAAASVAVRERSLIITVQSAALANALRLRLPHMQAACQTTKRLVFRIG